MIRQRKGESGRCEWLTVEYEQGWDCCRTLVLDVGSSRIYLGDIERNLDSTGMDCSPYARVPCTFA